MDHVIPSLRLRHRAALAMLDRAVRQAEEMGVPQCVTVMDAGGVRIVAVRMDGARLNAARIADAKARTSASTGLASGPETDAGGIVALATGGDQTGLEGGLPIFAGEVLLGGIGVSSASAEEDLEVARAAFLAVPGLSWTRG
jgi:uncharacterized protein GlcG (DUF336 family)